MSSFFERNKRKGSLAALLLLLRRGKGVVALLVLVAVLTGIFVLPGGMRIPWADKIADRMGFPSASADVRFSGMKGAIQSAKQDEQAWGIGGWGRKLLNRTSSYTPPASTSMELVLKKRPETSADTTAHLGTPESIAGVMRPEDVARGANPVALSKDDFFGGLVRSANAASMASGGPMADGGKLADGGQMAKNLEMAPSASMPTDGLMGSPVQVNGGSNLPNKIAGGKVNKLSSYSISQSILNMYSGGQKPEKSTQTFYQLAWTRAYSVTAAQPICADSNGCPKEYAANTAGLTFDGGQPAGQNERVMSNADLGEASPSAPNSQNDQVKSIVSESTQYYQDIQDCDNVDDWANPTGGGTPELSSDVKNGPAQQYVGKTLAQVCPGDPNENKSFMINGVLSERGLMDEMQHQSCLMQCKNIGDPNHPECDKWKPASPGSTCAQCDNGSCDKTTAQLCKGYGAQMKMICNQLNCVFQVKHDACPLTKPQPLDQHSCNQ